MELVDFLRETQAAIRAEAEKDVGPHEEPVPPEAIFTERVMMHMADEAITFEPTVCHFEALVSGKLDSRGNFKVKISGYAVSEISDDAGNPERLDLFVSLYKGVDELEPIPAVDLVVETGHGQHGALGCIQIRHLAQIDEGPADSRHALPGP